MAASSASRCTITFQNQSRSGLKLRENFLRPENFQRRGATSITLNWPTEIAFFVVVNSLKAKHHSLSQMGTPPLRSARWDCMSLWFPN